MHRVLILLGGALLAGSPVFPQPWDGWHGADGPDAGIAGSRSVDELHVILEERVSLLDAILRIQDELLTLARRDAGAAFLARPPMAQCRLALPEPWCSQLTGTFRPESAP